VRLAPPTPNTVFSREDTTETIGATGATRAATRRSIVSIAASSRSMNFTPIPAGAPAPFASRVQMTRPTADHVVPSASRTSNDNLLPIGTGVAVEIKTPPEPTSTTAASMRCPDGHS
jgi:hypothetical protein